MAPVRCGGLQPWRLVASRAIAVLAAAWAVEACAFDFVRHWVDSAVAPAPDRWIAASDLQAPPDAGQDQVPLDSATQPDVVEPDVGPPPFRFCWKGSAGNQVSCPAGWTAVAGGTTCADSWIASSGPAGDGWLSGCDGGAVATKVVCASAGVWQVEQATGSGKVDVACGKGSVVVGGGCTCNAAGARLFRSAHDRGAEAWRCACDPGGADKALAVCAAAPTAGQLGRSFADAEEWGEELAAPCKTGHVLSGGCVSVTEWLYLSDSNFGNPHNRWVCGVGALPLSYGEAQALCVSLPVEACP